MTDRLIVRRGYNIPAPRRILETNCFWLLEMMIPIYTQFNQKYSHVRLYSVQDTTFSTCVIV
jgi:hypothetical protein